MSIPAISCNLALPFVEASVFKRWAEISVKHPYAITAIATLMFFLFLGLAVQLDLKSSLTELLPTNAPSVKNLKKIQKTVASYSTLTVAVESPDLKASERFAEALVRRLNKLPPTMVRFIDYNMKNLQDFYRHNKLLYADLKDLRDFRVRLKKRIHEEEEASLIEDLDNNEKPKTDLKIKELERKYKKKSKSVDKYPDGYFVTPDRKLLAIFIRPPSTLDTYAEYKHMVKAVNKVIRQVNPKSFNPSMTVGLTGEVKTGIEERDALASDMKTIGILAFLAILALLVGYYRSLRMIIVIGLPMLLGLVAAFALAFVAIGYLNSATAFLTSIIAGNGINFPIILSARYFEERNLRDDRLEVLLERAMTSTAKATLIAAAAASIAYGSLSIAGFRGFRQFGIIGGTGMLFCWLSAFATGPALIVLLEKIRPFKKKAFKDARHPITNLVSRIINAGPKTIIVLAALLTVGSVAVLVPYMKDPFEYDFHKLRNRKSVESGSAKLSNKVDKIFDLPPSPMVVLADTPKQARQIKDMIIADPGREKVIGDVKTLWDFLPDHQKEKLAILRDIRSLIDKKIDFLPKKDRKELQKNRPADDLRVLTFKDIPVEISKAYTEITGRKGRIVYVYSKPHHSQLNGRYLLKFVGFIRKFKINGKPLIVAGQGPVFADMLSAIVHDGTKVTIVALILLTILLLFSFHRLSLSMLVLSSVFLAVIWLGGVAAAIGMKLNFLNFVVIPITLGIGVDYGVNLLSRYMLEQEPDRIHKTLVSTGGAVFLCSLTTIIGYATLITSMNMALQSFGILADIGELTALVASSIVMLAILVLLNRRKVNKV